MDYTLIGTAWGDGDVAVDIQRGEEFSESAKRLSDFIAGLPLTTAQNDELVRLAVEMVNAAERGAYLQGFLFGFQFGRDQ